MGASGGKAGAKSLIIPGPYTGGLAERRPPTRPRGARVGGLAVASPLVHGLGPRHKNDFAHALYTNEGRLRGLPISLCQSPPASLAPSLFSTLPFRKNFCASY